MKMDVRLGLCGCVAVDIVVSGRVWSWCVADGLGQVTKQRTAHVNKPITRATSVESTIHVERSELNQLIEP